VDLRAREREGGAGRGKGWETKAQGSCLGGKKKISHRLTTFQPMVGTDRLRIRGREKTKKRKDRTGTAINLKGMTIQS